MNARPGIYSLTAVLALVLCSASEAAKIDDGPSAATRPPTTEAQAEKPGAQVAPTRTAEEKLKAEDERKRQENELLVQQAEEDRRQEAVRLAQERKKKELLRQQAELERRCVIKQVMSDAEIAKCR